MCKCTSSVPAICAVSFGRFLAVIIGACPVRVQAEAPKPPQRTITFTVASPITSGTVPAGKPVALTWKIDNTGSRDLNGSLIF